jgi:hypothetical protein
MTRQLTDEQSILGIESRPKAIVYTTAYDVTLYSKDSSVIRDSKVKSNKQLTGKLRTKMALFIRMKNLAVVTMIPPRVLLPPR